MQWLNQVWLWGLAGLLVPVTIHLLSRKEGRVVHVGSLRHMQESATRQFRSLRPNELLLFALRSLLVVLLVLFLAGLQWQTDEPLPKWVLLERGVENEPPVKRLADSLTNRGYELRYLEEGFPLPSDTVSSAPLGSYWYLAERLQDEQLAHAVVFSRSFLKKFKGKRIAMPSNITWIEVPAAEKEFAFTFAAGDSLVVIEGISSPDLLQLEALENTGEGASVAGTIRSARVKIVATEAFQHDALVLQAALQVLNASPLFNIEIDTDRDTTSAVDYLFWFSDQPHPAGKHQKVVSLSPGEVAGFLVQTGPGTWQLKRRLNRETATENKLVFELSRLLAGAGEEVLSSHDHRLMPEAWRWSAQPGATGEPFEEQAAFDTKDQWLATLLLLVFLTERVIAWRRNQ